MQENLYENEKFVINFFLKFSFFIVLENSISHCCLCSKSIPKTLKLNHQHRSVVFNFKYNFYGL